MTTNKTITIRLEFFKIPGGILTIFQVAFLFCKLAKITDIANWSWWWVWSPYLIFIGLLLTLLCGFLIIVMIVWIIITIRNFFKTRKKLNNLMND